MKYFDRYILREVTAPFFIGLAGYSFVLLMNQLLLYPELFIVHGVPLGTTLKLFFYLTPSILAFTVPMSVLMGVLAGLSRLSSDAEIIAFKTLGISHPRLLRPLLLFAFGGWALTSVLALEVAPRFNFKWLQTMALAAAERAQIRLAPREFNEPVPNVTIYYQDLAPNRDWTNVFISTGRSPMETRVLLARRGRLDVYAASKRAVLNLFDVVQHEVVLDEPDSYHPGFFGHVEEELDAANFFGGYQAVKREREKTIGELQAGLIAAETSRADLERTRAALQTAITPQAALRRTENGYALAAADGEIRRHQIEIHKKFALPFACWVFVFLGVPLGISTRKGGRTSGFTLSVVIIFFYYVLITAGENLAMKGRIPPWLGMWGANILLGLVSLWLFFFSAREVRLAAVLSRRRARPAAAPDITPVSLKPVRRARPMLRFPNILDRYVIRKYLFIAGLAFASLVAVSVIVTFFEQIDNLYAHNKPMRVLLAYVGYRIPEFIHVGLPAVALIATLLTFGLLTKTNEMTALKACGISTYRAVLPALVIAVLLGLLSFHFQERVLPASNRKAQETWDKLNDAPARTTTAFNRRWVANKARDRFYYYRFFDPGKSEWSELSIFELDAERWTVRRRFFARRAVLQGGTIRLENGWIREFQEALPARLDKFKSLDIPMPDERTLFVNESKEPGQMTYGELRRHIIEIDDLGFDTRRMKVDLSVKLAFPWVALVMTFLGLPFAFSMGKRGTLVGIGAGLGIVIVYWVVLGIFKSLGYVGLLSVFLAAWGPNLIFGLLGGYLFLRVRT